MTKLDLRTTSLKLPPVSRSDLEPARRLIMLMPYLEADLTPAARRIWELANVMGARVQFIGLYNNATQELSLRRQLISMSAMVNDEKVSAEAEVIYGTDWVDVVQSRWQAGDMVVCFAEQRTNSLSKSLSDALQSKLKVPVYVLFGLYPQNRWRSNWLAQITTWAGSIALILGFFLLQVRVDHLALQLLSILLEIWMIWVWNSLFE